MNKPFLIILSILSLSHLSICANERELDLSDNLYKNEKVEFITYTHYVAMNLNYAPVKNLFNQLMQESKLKLHSRGEAHVTLITPIEFNKALAQKLKISELNELATEMDIQNSAFEVTCLGRGEKIIRDKKESNFFIVIKSDKLLEYRKKVEELFLKKGGKEGLFLPHNFYPHITVGFTKRDLHENDGVIKDAKSCYAGLNMVL